MQKNLFQNIMTADKFILQNAHVSRILSKLSVYSIKSNSLIFRWIFRFRHNNRVTRSYPD